MEVTKFLKVLSNPGRLEVFKSIASTCCECDESKGLENGNCVTNISKKLGLPQPTVSNYVKALLKSGLVTKKRKGKNIYFYAADGVKETIKLIENI
jgi:DNA-binding transcriptional ArsR family regulator